LRWPSGSAREGDGSFTPLDAYDTESSAGALWRRHRLGPVKVRSEAVAVPLAVALVIAAFVIPHLHLRIVTPLIHVSPARFRQLADTAPIFGWWDAHIGWGTPLAVLIGLLAVVWGPTVAQRLAWRALAVTAWATSAAWAFSLAMVDGWKRGFAGRLTAEHEYLRQVPTVTDIPAALRSFARRIPDFQPDSWTTHVSGHPPGALLTFVWLDRIGLGGGAWAATLCLLVGSSAATAVVVTLRALNDEVSARLAAPFVAVAPTAIWIAVSADGYFAGVAAWGIALLALAVSRVRLRVVSAGGSGLLLGWAIFLNYGLALIAILAAAVLITARRPREALITLAVAIPAALIVFAVFAWAGFWWFDGYTLVQQRYWQGIANDRPFQYWIWANLASVVCAIGLGSVAGVSKVFDVGAVRRRSGIHLLALAALIAILCADLSMLSKAETERIWLPFTIWLTAAPALLPQSSHRWWLALNIVGALLLNHVIYTNW
jgi:methylthioxylose transferase